MAGIDKSALNDALLLGTLLGALVCLLRTRKNPIARGVASAYIAILRGTPVLMLLLLLYYGVFAKAGLKPVTVAVFTFALNVSAHVAELLRPRPDRHARGHHHHRLLLLRQLRGGGLEVRLLARGGEVSGRCSGSFF